jgi:hypothetical protein
MVPTQQIQKFSEWHTAHFNPKCIINKHGGALYVQLGLLSPFWFFLLLGPQIPTHILNTFWHYFEHLTDYERTYALLGRQRNSSHCKTSLRVFNALIIDHVINFYFN